MRVSLLGKSCRVFNTVLYPIYTNHAYPVKGTNPGDNPFNALRLSSTDSVNVDNNVALMYILYHEDINTDMAFVKTFYKLLDGD